MAHTKSLTQDTGGVVGSVTFPADATKYLDGTGAFTTPAGTGTGTVTNTGTLTDHAVIVGNGGVDVSALASLGTTTTVLHGNASADPAFSAVVEADITLADNTTNNVGTSKHGFAPKSPNDATKYLDGTGAYSVPAGTGGVQLLAFIAYNPGTMAAVTTTSTTGADVDATNLTITFTVPSTGNVLVSMSAMASINNAANVVWWTLRDTGGNNIAGTRGRINSSTTLQHHTLRVAVTGLTPSASVTYRWGHGVNGNTGTTAYGDDAGTAPRGPAVMEVWEAP